jgi:hypothetical protein
LCFFDLSALFAAVFFIGFVLILGTLPKRLRRVKEAILAKKFGKKYHWSGDEQAPEEKPKRFPGTQKF